MPTTAPAERKKTQRASNVKAIQEAAKPLFEQQGFAATSIEQIARQTGISVGAIYLYFKSKEDLYISILPQWLNTLMTALTPASKNTAALSEIWDRLQRWSIDHAEGALALMFLGQPKLAGRFSPEVGQAASTAIDAIKTTITDLIEAHYKLDHSATIPAQLLWTIFIGELSLGLAQEALSAPPKMSMFTAIVALEEIVRRPAS